MLLCLTNQDIYTVRETVTVMNTSTNLSRSTQFLNKRGNVFTFFIDVTFIHPEIFQQVQYFLTFFCPKGGSTLSLKNLYNKFC